jgi:DNA polymerase III gamma/tau subunit
MQGLIETLHNSLLFKAGVESAAGSMALTIDNLKLEIGEIKRLIELLSEAKNELKYAVLPQIPLELVIVEWGMPPEVATPAPLARGPVAGLPPKSSPLTVRAAGNPSSGVTPTIKTEMPNVTQQDIAKYSENDALWTALIDKVKTYNHSVAGVLRGCTIKSYDSKTLLLETNFKFHKDKLSERKTQEILEESCREVTKKKIKIEIILKTRLH